MVKLYQFPRIEGWRVANCSPPCEELETWLRLAGIPYELGPWPMTVAPPKGKWPYIQDDRLEGQVIGDAGMIIDHLTRTRGIDADRGLTPAERGISRAFRRMVKENLYWLVIQIRYREEKNWIQYRAALTPMIDVLYGGDAQKVEEFFVELRQKFLNQIAGHGLARHTTEEIHQIGADDMIAVSEFLGDKPFLFGENPTTADATVYAHVTGVINVPYDGPSVRAARERKNLVDYCDRMCKRFFSDL